MGNVPSDIGAVAGAPEVTYGTDPNPTRAMRLTGPPTISDNDEFTNTEQLSPSRVTTPGARKNIDLDFGMQSYMTLLPTTGTIHPQHHEILIAAGLNVVVVGVGASGTTYTVTPQNSGYGSSAFHSFDFNTADAEASLIKALGTRGDLVFSFDPSNEYPLLDFTGKSLATFNTPFGVVSLPVDPNLAIIPMDQKTVCFGFELDGNALALESFSLTLNNEFVSKDPGLTDCGGSSEIVLKTGTPSFEMVLTSTKGLIDGTDTQDWIAQAQANDVDFAGVLSFQSPFNGQTFTLTMPKMRFQGLAQGDGNNDLKAWTVTGVLSEVTPGIGDTFTYVQEIV
jgi:hypothetical protein